MQASLKTRLIVPTLLVAMIATEGVAALPQVVSTSPPNGAIGVRPDIDQVIVRLDKPVTGGGNAETCLAVSDGWGLKSASVLIWPENVIHISREIYMFCPNPEFGCPECFPETLPLGSTVSLTLNPPGAGPNCFKDSDGNLLPTFTVSFTIRKNSNDPPIEPQVLATDPPNGATDVSWDLRNISITFSEAMTGDSDIFTYWWPSYSTTWSADKKTLTLTRVDPGPLALSGRTVVLILNHGGASGFRDFEGNLLPESTYSFTLSGDIKASLEKNHDLRILRIPADPAKGFHWPYYLSIPNAPSEQPQLFVAPNNTGYPAVDHVFHDIRARETLYQNIGFLGDWQLRLPLLVPTFPRTNNLYIQSLNYFHHSYCAPLSFQRVDLQLRAMIEDAREKLRAEGVTVDDRVLMNGFSASGSFTTLFSALQPEIVKAQAAGTMDFPILPVATWEGMNLVYPVGVSDLQFFTGKPFNLEAYRRIPQLFFRGDQDQNSANDFSRLSSQDFTKLLTLLGEPVQYGWQRMPLAKRIHDSVDTASEFAVYPGVGHAYSDEIMADLKNFFEQYRLTDAPLMPVPEGPRAIAQRPSVFTYKSRDPSRARPLGVGPIASGGDAVNLSVALHRFSGPVDVYFGLSLPGDSNIYLLRSDYGFQPLAQGLTPWKIGVTEKTEERLTGDIKVQTLPSGRYNLYLAVMPSGSLNGYDLWSTYFVIP